MTAWSAKLSTVRSFFGEWFDVRLKDGDDTQEDFFTQHRDSKHRSVALLFHQSGEFVIAFFQNVADMNCLTACRGPTSNCAKTGAEWVSPQVLSEAWECTVSRRKNQKFTVELKNVTTMAPQRRVALSMSASRVCLG